MTIEVKYVEKNNLEYLGGEDEKSAGSCLSNLSGD